MGIRVPNLGLGDGKTGDTELKIRQDYNHNFSDPTNAASRLVGKGVGQVPLFTAKGISDTGIGGLVDTINETTVQGLIEALYLKGACVFRTAVSNPITYAYGTGFFTLGGDTFAGYTVSHAGLGIKFFSGLREHKSNPVIYDLWTSRNATKDPNGFLKGASPIAEIYSDKMDLNDDAQRQGGITFKKLGVGDYLVKGSLGFAQEGWYIETPKDANGNVLVAVVYEQLANNDISVKTYAKKFDDETGDIVPNLARPRDIPEGRFISLRLHELPQEPPVMPTETQPEV